MSPVNEPAQIIPLVHAPNRDAVTHAERHALSNIEVMGDQQRPAIADIDNETLVAGAIVVIM